VHLADRVIERAHFLHASVAAARWRAGRGDRRIAVWPKAALASSLTKTSAVCNICGWRGRAFEGIAHSESALCPVCGSISRDRFLYWCWTRRTGYDPQAKVLETSPRLNQTYRDKMAERVDYTSSDYDESAHRGAMRLDLQDIALPADTLDVVLTPHVLEHVPDTDKALSELFRVMKPGGHVFLQIPLPQAKTAPPTEPEYHGDNTLVFWRFGWDLAEMIRSAGFGCDVLVTSELRDAALDKRDFGYHGADCDVADLMAGADPAAMTVVADAAQAERHGFRPAFQFVTFDCHKPRSPTP
jgi:SAM-dependent methyltransferase